MGLISTLEKQSTSLFQAVNQRLAQNSFNWREASEEKGGLQFFSCDARVLFGAEGVI
jgi:hypothetical protein